MDGLIYGQPSQQHDGNVCLWKAIHLLCGQCIISDSMRRYGVVSENSKLTLADGNVGPREVSLLVLADSSVEPVVQYVVPAIECVAFVGSADFLDIQRGISSD